MALPRVLATLLLLGLTSPVLAADVRPLCADRPGKATPPCIVDTGYVQFELGAVDASFDHGADSYALANLVARAGLTTTLEADVGWTPLTVVPGHRGTTGDLVLALKQSLRNPDGSGFSAAVQPQLTVPTSGGDVAGALLLPLARALSDSVGLSFTPELDLVPDAAHGGVHFGATAVIAGAVAVGPCSFGSELWSSVDDDPAGRVWQASVDLTAAWIPATQPNLQFDVGSNFGLTDATAAVEIYVGVTRRFSTSFHE